MLTLTIANETGVILSDHEFDSHEGKLCPSTSECRACVALLRRTLSFLELHLSTWDGDHADVVADGCGAASQVDGDIPIPRTRRS